VTDWAAYAKERKAWAEALFGPGVDQYNIEDLHAQLRTVQRSTALEPIAAATSALWRNGVLTGSYGGQMASDWLCAFVAQEVLRIASDLGPDSLQERSLARAFKIAHGIEDYFQIKKREGLSGRDLRDAERSFFFRTADEQFGPQAKRWHLIPRYLSLLETIPLQVGRAADPDLAGEFNSMFGLSLREFMAIGVAILGMTLSTAGAPFTDKMLLNTDVPTLRNVMTAEKLSGFMAATSRTPGEMRAIISEEGDPPAGLERYWFNPLRRYPVVRLDSHYVVPSLWLLLERITSGLYFDFLEPRIGDNAGIRQFTSFLGRVFEQHVGNELAHHFTSDVLRPEQTYLGGQWATADWTLMEGRRATLFECKTTRLNKRERERGDVNAIRAKLHEEIIPAIKRLPTKADHLRKHVRGLETWPAVEDFEFVIVTLDPWWPEVITRQVIAEELAGTTVGDTRFHLMWVGQLEHLGSYLQAMPIFDLLRERWSMKQEMDSREFLYQMAVKLGLTTQSPRMEAVAEAFFAGLIPAEARG